MTHLISEAARATGFSESTLRYYERQAIVVPARTDTGYRSYSDSDLETLRFVARAKRLGLTLEDIREVMHLLEQGECRPVQSRLVDMLQERRVSALTEVSQLFDLAERLNRTTAQLSGGVVEGGCNESCGCRSDVEAPLTCSLEPHAFDERVDEWRSVIAQADRRQDEPDGVTLAFGPEVDVGRLAQLAAAEQECCTFFRFTLFIAGDGVRLHIWAPDDARGLIDTLLQPAA